MFDIGFWEIMLIAVVALVVVGPERLPRVIRVTGLWIGRATASLQSVRNEISRELRADEIRRAINQPEDIPIVREILSPEIESSNKGTDKEQENKKDTNGDG